MKIYTILAGMLLLLGAEIHACTGGTFAGTLNPVAGYQTQSVTGNQYYTVNVSCGSTYNFTFCSNGGSASWDTQITILDNTGTSTLAYNDDFCSLQSDVSYTANFNGTIRVLINLYNCSTSTGNSGTLAYNANLVTIGPSFTLNSQSCTQATASITGTTGGSFSFDPAPGDGATINASTGAISGGTPGSSYSVSYTVCGNTNTESVTLQTLNCWELNGSAQWITVGAQECIQLTAEANNQTGCAWDGNLIDFNTNFSLALDYYFGNNMGGADGTTFTFQPNQGACGAAGAQLGAGGIPNSLIIEMDTYDNDGGSNNDLTSDHISVEIDGDLPDDPINFPANSAPYCGPVSALASGNNIDDGNLHSILIEWDATTQQLLIYFDGALRLSCTGDFVNTVFGGNNEVYWGATAATGGLNNQQYFCPQTVIFLPTELISFESICENDSEFLIWKTATEDRLDYFQIEYTSNGILFYELGTVQAVGNSTQLQNYSFQVPNSEKQLNRYYRIKAIDLDGYSESSDLIASTNCSKSSNDYLLNYSFSNNNLSLQLNGVDFNIQLISPTGQLIPVSFSHLNSNYFAQNIPVSSGVYLLQIEDAISGSTEIYRIFHAKD